MSLPSDSIKQKCRTLRTAISRYEGTTETLQKNLIDIQARLIEAKDKIETLLSCRAFFQKEAEVAQEDVITLLSSVVSMALADVFPDPYTCVIESGIKRNSTEAVVLFEREDVKVEPKDSAGGGPVDVASFAARVAFVHLSRSQPIIIADEPFKYVSRNLLSKCPEMLHMLSEKLGMQFIIISHLEEVIADADNVITIHKGCVK